VKFARAKALKTGRDLRALSVSQIGVMNASRLH